MADSSSFKSYVFPIIMMLLSALVGYGISVLPKFKRDAALKLDNVYISREDQPTFPYGMWELTEVGEDKLNQEKEYYTYVANNLPPGMKKYEAHPHEKNGLGIMAYAVNWATKLELLQQSSSYYGQGLPLKVPQELVDTLKNHDEWPLSLPPDTFANDGAKFEAYPGEIQELVAWANRKKLAVVSRYIGDKITSPALKVAIRNDGGKPATLYGLYCRNIYSTGGEAGAGGMSYTLQVMNEQKILNLNYKQDGSLLFNEPIVVEPESPALLEVMLNMEEAAFGDGSGWLTYALFLRYNNGDALDDLYVGTFIQGDGVELPGWQFPWNDPSPLSGAPSAPAPFPRSR